MFFFSVSYPFFLIFQNKTKLDIKLTELYGIEFEVNQCLHQDETQLIPNNIARYEESKANNNQTDQLLYSSR